MAKFTRERALRHRVLLKRTHRLYRELDLQLRNKTPKRKVKAKLREDRSPAMAANECRSMDFLSDQLFDGRTIRVLTIVDNFTRLSPAIDARMNYRGVDVVGTLNRVAAEYGRRKRIRVENGPEFVSKYLDLGASKHDVILDFSRPGKPTDNAFAESFNGRVRAECLNAYWLGGTTTTTTLRTAPLAIKPHGSTLLAQGGLARREPRKPVFLIKTGPNNGCGSGTKQLKFHPDNQTGPGYFGARAYTGGISRTWWPRIWAERPTKMGRAADLHRDDAAGQFVEQRSQLVIWHLTLQHDPSSLVQFSNTTAVLAQIDPEHRAGHSMITAQRADSSTLLSQALSRDASVGRMRQFGHTRGKLIAEHHAHAPNGSSGNYGFDTSAGSKMFVDPRSPAKGAWKECQSFRTLLELADAYQAAKNTEDAISTINLIYQICDGPSDVK
eukprot:gene22321-28906_t